MCPTVLVFNFVVDLLNETLFIKTQRWIERTQPRPQSDLPDCIHSHKENWQQPYHVRWPIPSRDLVDKLVWQVAIVLPFWTFLAHGWVSLATARLPETEWIYRTIGWATPRPNHAHSKVARLDHAHTPPFATSLHTGVGVIWRDGGGWRYVVHYIRSSFSALYALEYLLTDLQEAQTKRRSATPRAKWLATVGRLRIGVWPRAAVLHRQDQEKGK